jgi:hypothetical protein
VKSQNGRRTAFLCGSDHDKKTGKEWQTAECKKREAAAFSEWQRRQVEEVNGESRLAPIRRKIATLKPGQSVMVECNTVEASRAAKVLRAPPAMRYSCRKVGPHTAVTLVRVDASSITDQIEALDIGESVVVPCTMQKAQVTSRQILKDRNDETSRFICRTVDGGAKVVRQPRLDALAVGQSVRFGEDLEEALDLIRICLEKHARGVMLEAYGITAGDDGAFFVTRLK